MASGNRYEAIIERVFFRHYEPGSKDFEFRREELVEIADELAIALPKNLGDVLYSFRFRSNLPASIQETAEEENEWVIILAGHGSYRFKQVRQGNVLPREDQRVIKIPDATPEIVVANAMTDEQAVLAKIRYNRLVDIFLGVTAYSLQSHLRTTVPQVGQIEIDEVYVGVNRNGEQFVVPVQAKGGKDKIGSVQALQDVACCRHKFPSLTCRPVASQSLPDDTIAMFELIEEDDEIRVVDEKHYRLVPSESISEEDRVSYRVR